MKRLRMFPSLPTSPVDSGGTPLDRNCAKCALSPGPGRACLPADGAPGADLLIVGDSPIKGAARPFASKSGAYVRSLVAQNWQGGVVYDYAIKCPVPGNTKLKDAMKPLTACRSYLAEVIESVKPERILALGSWAVVGLLGRSLDMESVRRGYGWVKGTTPVFLLHGPGSIQENKFLKKRYEADFEWALTTDIPRPAHVDGIVHVIMDEKDALFAESVLNDYDELLFDTETAGVVHNADFKIICAGLVPVDQLETDAWVWSDDALSDPGAVAALRRLLTTKKISGSNIKYDAVAAEQCLGIDIQHIEFDTQLVRKLAEPTCMGRLEYAAELVGMGGHKEEAQAALRKAISGTRLKSPRPGDKPQSHWCAQAIRNGTPGATPMNYAYGLLPDDVLWRYNARDVLASATATIHLRKRTLRDAPKEMKLWDDLYRPAVRSFKRIERVGMLADLQAFEAFSMHLNVGLDDLRQKFQAYGPTFNPNAAKQVADILFNRLKLPKQGLSEKTGEPSTAKDTLQRLAGMHPFVDQMMEWRRLEKLDGTYAAGMIPHILSDGRIHPTFRLDGTETGRVSSENPNGQNIPRSETIEGKMARDGFTVTPGRVMLSFDQSQIELRVAAGMSGDVEMIEIFKSGMDYHMRTAQMIAKVVWGIVEEQVGKFHRSYAKCFHPNTEILTRSGWKQIRNLAQGEEVAAAIPDGGRARLEWQVPTEVFTMKHPSGKLIKFKNLGIDISVTPDHRMLGFNKSGEHKVELAKDWTGGRYWLNAGELSGSVIVDENLLRLAVAVQADGSITGSGIRFGFKKLRKVERLRRLLDAAGISHTLTARGPVCDFYVNAASRQRILELLDWKSLPWRWLDLTADLRRVVVEEAAFWDAHQGGNWRMYKYSSTDKQSVEVLQALASSVGRKTRLTFDGYIYVLSVKDHAHARSGNLEKIEEVFTDEVACLSVPSTFVLVRSGGIPVITGQTVNFGLLYGKTDAGLAQQLGCSVEDAAKVRRTILGRFKKLAELIKRLLYQVQRYGFVEVPWFDGASHVRPLYEAGGHDHWKKQNAENSSINCLDAETEALTRRGWVKGFDLRPDDILLTKNPKTGELEWQGMTDLKLWPEYEGPIVEFKSKSFHAVSTPDHRWLVRDKRTGQDVERTSRTLSQWGDHRIHRTGEYSAVGGSSMTPDEAELLGWFATDGSVQKTAKKGGNGTRGPKAKAGGFRAMICQSQIGNPEKCARIDALIGRLGHLTSRSVSKAGEVFWRLDHVLTEVLLRAAPNRTLTVGTLLGLDRPCLDRLREAMLLGDGTFGTKDVLCTGRKEQAEAFQILCTLTGSAASIVWRDMSMYSPKSAKMKNVPKMSGIWLVTILRRTTAQVTREQRREVVAKCPVWCPIVPNTFFVARRSGNVFITGNTPIQGRAAWYTIAAIPLIHAWIDESGADAEIINTVHDSVMIDCSRGNADEVVENVCRIMEGFDCWGVPLVVDIDAGERWGSLRSVNRGEKLAQAEVRWVAEHLIKEG